MTKLLFLLKKTQPYGDYSYVAKSGLLNSARLTAQELEDKNLAKTKIAICVDGNSIDKEIDEYKPDLCIIEALWVTPDKVREVQKLHPDVRFIVRIHSEVPFLANEGVAVDWIKQYGNIDNVEVAFNSYETYDDFMWVIDFSPLSYLPNLYPTKSIADIKSLSRRWLKYIFDTKRINLKNKKEVHIGCFGAVRPMKNQLQQAFASIQFGNKHNIKVYFHINASRIEMGGDGPLKNIQAAFKNTDHELVEHPWLSRESFLHLVSEMDLGLQASFSESFNIVSADFISQEVPIIGSNNIGWLPEACKVEPTSSKQLVRKIEESLFYRDLFVDLERVALFKYNRKALKVWRRGLI